MFFVVAALIAVAVGLLLTAPLLLRRGAAARRSAHDMQVYRDQLAEVERDVARGLLGEAEAAAVRAEVSRRLLGAADSEAAETEAAAAPAPLSRAAAAGLLVVVLGAGLGLYAFLGAPQLPDQPLQARIAAFEQARANRPGQAEAQAEVIAQFGEPDLSAVEPEHLALLDQLRGILAERPDDLQGHRLLATNLAQLGLWAEAQTAQGEVLRILGDDARAEDVLDRAEYMVLAANGYVSPQAEALLDQGLEMSPLDQRGRYYAGLTLGQAGRPDLTYRIWSQLVQEGPQDAPWVQAILPALPQVAAAAGITPDRGPTAGDIAAAGEMSAQDRDAMIRGMVEGLGERLATEGGPPQDWARLIRSLGILGETAQASAIWNEAQDTFADDPAALALLREAARAAEVAN